MFAATSPWLVWQGEPPEPRWRNIRLAEITWLMCQQKTGVRWGC